MVAPARRDPATRAALISGAAVASVGSLVLALVEAGPLSLLMIQHLLVMNVLAPLAAATIRWTPPTGRGALWLAGTLQVVLLYAWHLPSSQQAAAASWPLHLVALTGLAGCSYWFWSLVLGYGGAAQWRALAALLLTGKLACLLGALLIFAQRDLYLLDGLALPFCSLGPSTLADQQLAGLLMITACPLSYLVAGVVLAAQMLAADDADDAREGCSVATR